MNQMNSSIQNHGMEKKPYSKPRIEKIKLLLEEAVLGVGCKTFSTGPNQYGFDSCLDSTCVNSSDLAS